MSEIEGPPVYKATLEVEPIGPNPVNSPIMMSLSFSDQNEEPYDPPLGDITITVEDPTAESTMYTSTSSPAISKYADGTYTIEVEGNKSGNWVSRGQGPDPASNVITSPDVETIFQPTEVSS